jgi:large subunit ribosomal protein L21
MFAIIETGGKQYKVQKDYVFDVELLEGKNAGDKVSFDKVLLVSDDADIKIGTPYIKGAKIAGIVLSVAKDKKVTTFKFKRKTNYHRTIGHRQIYTRVKIESIKGE